MSTLLAPVSSGFTLRSYQEAAVKRALVYLTHPQYRGRHGLIVAPTGSGKSLLIASIATALDGPCLVFQPSKEILEQNAEKLRGYGYFPAVYSAALNKRRVGAITLATIGSVVRRPEIFRDVQYVLIDECHLVNAKGGMYRDFLAALEQVRVIGLTATPYRLASNANGSMLRFLTRTRPRIFQDVVHYTNLGPLFKAGFLAPLVYHTEPVLDPSRIRLNSTGADFDDASLQRHFLEVGFQGQLQATVEQLLAAGHQSILVFTRFVHEAEALAAAVPGAAVVTATSSPDDRARILWQFRKGLLKVVANVGVLTVGFDYPELTTVVLARPTMSLNLYYQMTGRVLRPHPSKPAAHVVDLVGLVERFGKLEDLHMQPAGKRGDSWEIVSAGTPLTNVYYGEPRAFAPPPPQQRERSTPW